MINKVKVQILSLDRKYNYIKWLIVCFVIVMAFFTNLGLSYLIFKKSNPAIEKPYGMLLQGMLVLLSFFILCMLLYQYIKITKKDKALFDRMIDCRYKICGVFFLFTLIFHLNGFSLSIWDRYIHSKNSINILFGMNRDITSDIWALAIPDIFNQIENGFPLFNYDIMSNGANAILMGLPVLDITILAKPFMWGYILLGKEIGLSWHWFGKIIVLFLSSYEICNWFADEKKKISLIFAFILTCSPAVMWWLGQGIIDAVIFFQVCVALIIAYFNYHDSIVKKIMISVALFVAGCSFIFVLYPPLQVPLGFLFLIISSKIIIDEKMKLKRSDIVYISIILVGILCMLIRYLELTANDIDLLKNTVYPGTRVITGGRYRLSNLYYLFMQFLLPIKNVSIENNCEMSFFVPFIPVVLIVFPFVLKKCKKKLYWILYLYELFLISWLFIPYPEILGKVTLFSYVTENRVTIIIGLISVYLAVITLSNVNLKELYSKKVAAIIFSACLLITLFFIVKYDGGGYLAFLGKWSLMLIFIATLIWAFYYFIFIFGYKKHALAFTVIAILISGGTINPIAIGSGSLLKSELAIKVFEIEQSNPDSLWVINENFPYNNYLLNFGVKCFNAHNSYPDYNKWSKIDVHGSKKEIYNRYAHVSVEITKEKSDLELTASDAIKVTLNTQNIKDLGVKYILSKQEISQLGYKKIYTDEISGFSIYKV